MTGAGFILPSCQSQLISTDKTATATPDQSIIQTLTSRPMVKPTGEIQLEEGIDAIATASPPWNPTAQVATGQVVDYDLRLLKQELQMMLDSLGGLESVVPYGGVVVMKVNLTGGIQSHNMGGLPAVETIATHPLVSRALGELLIDAGAGELWIVEAVYEWESFRDWGYEEIARYLNAQLVDLNQPDPFRSFAKVSVPGGLIYDEFNFHPILAECDTFISIAKMKCHIECGVTHSMKNLIGLVPYRLYHLHEADNWRSAFHGSAHELSGRLPRVVIDLNLARPVHLAVVDGIKTIEAGEGSWAAGARQIMPGVVLAGKNAVSTDTIATAIQGFDPTTEYPQTPFTRAINYLNLANALGMGTNRLTEIEVLGPAVKDLATPFKPATGYG